MNFYNFFNSYYYFFIFFSLLILSLQDLYALEVDALTYLSTILLLLSNTKYYDSMCFSIIGVILIILLSKVYYEKEITTYADLGLILACSSQIDLMNLGVFLILISLFSFVYCVVLKKNKFPAIPFISSAFFIVLSEKLNVLTIFVKLNFFPYILKYLTIAYKDYYYFFIFAGLLTISLQNLLKHKSNHLMRYTTFLLIASKASQFESFLITFFAMIVIFVISTFYTKIVNEYSNLILILMCSSHFKTQQLGFFFFLIAIFSSTLKMFAKVSSKEINNNFIESNFSTSIVSLAFLIANLLK